MKKVLASACLTTDVKEGRGRESGKHKLNFTTKVFDKNGEQTVCFITLEIGKEANKGIGGTGMSQSQSTFSICRYL